MTYFITFSCYGARLHGDESGSVDRRHNVPGAPLVDADPKRAAAARARMQEEPYAMDARRRNLVLESVHQVCACRQWTLLSAHVRSNHVHIIVDAADKAERVLNTFKTYASRRLNVARIDPPGRRRWSRHGSTCYLWRREEIELALAYVADDQGPPMALYVNENR